jgi:hypothetical protein
MEAMSYTTLGGGAAAEMFDRELEKILANIQDPNRPYKPPREITLKLTMKPDENREKVSISIAVSSKAPGFKSFDSLAYLGVDQRDRTKHRAYERAHPDQQRLPFMIPDPQEIPEVQTSEERKTHA